MALCLLMRQEKNTTGVFARAQSVLEYPAFPATPPGRSDKIHFRWVTWLHQHAFLATPTRAMPRIATFATDTTGIGSTAAVDRTGFAVLTLVRSTVTIAATAHTGALGIAAQLARRAAAVHRTIFTVLAQLRSTLTVTATTGTTAHGIATDLAGCAATIHRTDLAVLGLLPSAHTVSADGKRSASEKQDKKHQGKSWNDSVDGHGCLRNKEMHRYSLKTYAGYPMTATVSRYGHPFTPL